MKRKDILRRLEERLARGEISEKTYIEIKARYESEPEEPEESEGAEGVGGTMTDLGSTISAAVAEATAAASEAATEATRAVREAMRGIDISGIGTKLTDEAIKIVGSGVVTGNPVRTVNFQAAGSAKVQGPLEADVARVAGSCVFEGDVHVEEFHCSGSARIAGDLNAEDIEASGSLQVSRKVTAEDISASGSFRVEGDVTAEDISASGSFQVSGNVTAEDFHSGGSVRIAGALKCEDFHSGGSVEIDGGLSAENVVIDLGGSSRISTIVAEDIQVKATGGFFRVRGDLTADRIEGKDIDLEATVATFVKGDDVRIGPHCRIDVVEAKQLVVHQSSEVRERRGAS
jgi:cytoskeletal protein CcmA (bactofilin family)